MRPKKKAAGKAAFLVSGIVLFFYSLITLRIEYDSSVFNLTV